MGKAGPKLDDQTAGVVRGLINNLVNAMAVRAARIVAEAHIASFDLTPDYGNHTDDAGVQEQQTLQYYTAQTEQVGDLADRLAKKSEDIQVRFVQDIFRYFLAVDSPLLEYGKLPKLSQLAANMMTPMLCDIACQALADGQDHYIHGIYDNRVLLSVASALDTCKSFERQMNGFLATNNMN